MRKYDTLQVCTMKTNSRSNKRVSSGYIAFVRKHEEPRGVVRFLEITEDLIL